MTMARGRRKAADVAEDEAKGAVTGEEAKMDFAKAKSLLLNDVRVANSRAGEHNQEASTAYKAIKKQCNISTSMAKLVLKLHGLDDDKRDHELRSLRGLLLAFNMGLTPDLVDTMEGHNSGAEIIPIRAGITGDELAGLGLTGGGLATLDGDDGDD
jgi:hypothetical protein